MHKNRITFIILSQVFLKALVLLNVIHLVFVIYSVELIFTTMPNAVKFFAGFMPVFISVFQLNKQRKTVILLHVSCFHCDMFYIKQGNLGL